MDPIDLVKVWDAPDLSKLTPKQWSIRLPIQVAAKINALSEMYPRKSKTEIIGDLLATALEQLEKGFPYVEGQYVADCPDTGEPLHEDVGPRSKFSTLTQKYLTDLEKEIESK